LDAVQSAELASHQIPEIMQPIDFRPIFPALGYFSLRTLSTIGFGNNTPLTLQARMQRSPKLPLANSIWRSWSPDWWVCK